MTTVHHTAQEKRSAGGAVSQAAIARVAHESVLPERLPAPTPTQSAAEATLPELVAVALQSNPRLRRLEQEAAAAWARVPQLEALPDPTIGANVFGHPIETAAGSQRANINFMQMIPWLERLSAQGQQAAYEALSLEQVTQAERLKVAADVEELWSRLYVLTQQLRINRANQELLQSLIEVANARVGAGTATQADVLLGSLEISRLAEEVVSLEQQLASTKAMLNQLLDRPADTPLSVPDELQVRLPSLTLEALRQLALERQPEIAAARLRVQASTWGIEVAELRRRPDVSLGANYFVMDDNRPPSRIVDVGRDAWSAGASFSVPLWDRKYDAIEAEAARRHFAAHAGEDEIVRRYDALLVDLVAQARAADETAELYQSTILPQARQTLAADQQSYGQGRVEFDRVIRDFRSVLTLEVGYHQALGRLATALARIEQATATNVDALPGRAQGFDVPPEPDDAPVPAPKPAPLGPAGLDARPLPMDR
ncbi:MAG: TolC family protein [Planctomycetes bacterium]|nr:TolC family protein [Planctomycetota bacterium]